MNTFRCTGALLTLLLVTRAGSAQQLVLDLNDGGGSSPQSFVEFDGKLVFAGFDGAGEFDLFEYTDETGGRRIGHQTEYTLGPGQPTLTVFDGRMFFSSGGRDPLGAELWAWNGDGLPTLVADVFPGSSDSNPRDMTVFKGKLYFTTDVVQNRSDMWVYDGVNPPHRPFQPGTGGNLIEDLFVFGEYLFYSAVTPEGWVLFRYDGLNSPEVAFQEEGRHWVYPKFLTAFGDRLVFSARETPSSVPVLWHTDGVSLPSSVPDELPSNSAMVNPQRFIQYGDALYFAAYDGMTGQGLWKWDSESDPVLVAESDELGFHDLRDFVLFDGDLLFRTDDDVWRLDGDGEPAIVTALGPHEPRELYSWGDRLFFQGREGGIDPELWVWDGTGSPEKAADLNSSRSSNPEVLAVRDGAVYFGSTINRLKLYRFSADQGLTTIGLSGLATGDSDPSAAVTWNDRLLFLADRPVPGSGQLLPTVLYEYEGGDQAVAIGVVRERLGGDSSEQLPDQLVPYRDRLYFAGESLNEGMELWSFDGVNAPSMEVDIVQGGSSSNPANFTEYGDALIFGGKSSSGAVIYRYVPEGADPDVILEQELHERPVAVGGILYFVAGDRLWSYDGASDPAELDPGLSVGARPENLVELDGRLYFTASDRIWRLADDGSTAEDIVPGTTTFSEVDGLFALGRALCFAGDDGQIGKEIWCLDSATGNLTGFDVQRYGEQHSNPDHFTVAADRVYFSAFDDLYGRELWSLSAQKAAHAEDAPDETPRKAFEISSIYPMPARSWIQLNIIAAASQRIRLEMFDILGRSVYRSTSELVTGGQEHSIRISRAGLPAGAYVLRVSGQSASLSRVILYAE